VILVAVASVLLGALGFLGYAADRERQLEKLHRELAANAEQAAAGLVLPVWNFDHDQIDKMIDSVMIDENIYAIVVKLSDVHGTIHARVRNHEWKSEVIDKDIQSKNHLVEERKIQTPEETVGTVKVLATTKFVEATQRRALLMIVTTIVLVAIILVSSLYLLLNRLVLRPLKNLETHAIAVSSGERNQPNSPNLQFRGELANLKSALEKMVTQLDARYIALQESGAELRRAHDLLEQRVRDRTAELVAANERLQELDRLKSQFLATMSHELRTPLNSIIGFTGLICQGMAGPVNEEQAKQLGMVYNSALHLLSLISDLLDLSRIEAGKMRLEVSAFNFGDVISDVVACLSPIVKQKGLTLDAELGDTRLQMAGDRKRCYQVLLNITNNAVKFTEHGKVHISARFDDGMLRVNVTDTGIGIKPEQMTMLFEAFRQLDGSAKRNHEGTGLGLYLCRKLLTLMGGDISVKSEYGKGSQFSFSVPRQPVAASL
jgi:signal transduction histidine kinase